MAKINELEWMEKANQIRKLLELDSNGPIDIERALIASNDFTIVYKEMNKNISGLCIKDDNNKIIAINSSLSKGRQRFTIAHELCHLYFHDEGYYVCNFSDFNEVKSDYEKEADAFASYFLAPYFSFNEDYNEYIKKYNDKITAIIQLEQKYGLSHLATLIRLRKMGYIKESELNNYKVLKVKELATIKGMDDSLYLPTNENKTKGRYIYLTEKLLSEEKISKGKYEELLLEAFRGDIVFGEDNEYLLD